MKSRRSRKWHARVVVREYDAALKNLDRVDADFRFERACCGELLIRQRYSKEELKERYLRQMRSMLINPNVLGSAAGMQAQQQMKLKALNMQQALNMAFSAGIGKVVVQESYAGDDARGLPIFNPQ